MISTMQLVGAVELGCLYGIIAIGVYLSFRILDFPDLTVDGSFPLGAAVAATMIVSGYNPWFATLVAIGAGMLAGMITAWLNVRWKILHLLASILTMTALYSINIRIMGKPNVSLLSEATIFTQIKSLLPFAGMAFIMGLMCLAVILFINWFLHTEKGLAMRATGANPRMARAQGARVNYYVIAGIALSNALVAFAGALSAQSQGYADVSMGAGTIIIGLAAVIIGEAFFKTRKVIVALVACLIGSIVYQVVITFALNVDAIGLQAYDLKLVMAVIITIALIAPKIKGELMRKYKRTMGRQPS